MAADLLTMDDYLGQSLTRSPRANDTVAKTGAIDPALIAAEGALLDRDGLPGRPWYRHLIYAPKPTYAPEVLPGVAEVEPRK